MRVKIMVNYNYNSENQIIKKTEELRSTPNLKTLKERFNDRTFNPISKLTLKENFLNNSVNNFKDYLRSNGLGYSLDKNLYYNNLFVEIAKKRKKEAEKQKLQSFNKTEKIKKVQDIFKEVTDLCDKYSIDALNINVLKNIMSIAKNKSIHYCFDLINSNKPEDLFISCIDLFLDLKYEILEYEKKAQVAKNFLKEIETKNENNEKEIENEKREANDYIANEKKSIENKLNEKIQIFENEYKEANKIEFEKNLKKNEKLSEEVTELCNQLDLHKLVKKQIKGKIYINTEAKNRYVDYCKEMLNSNKLNYEHKEPFDIYFKSLNELKDKILKYKEKLNSKCYLKNTENKSEEEKNKEYIEERASIRRAIIETYTNLNLMFYEKMQIFENEDEKIGIKDFEKKITESGNTNEKVKEFWKQLNLNINEKNILEDKIKYMNLAKDIYEDYYVKKFNLSRLRNKHKVPFDLYFESLNNLNEKVLKSKNNLDYGETYLKEAKNKNKSNIKSEKEETMTKCINNERKFIYNEIIKTYRNITNMFNDMMQIFKNEDKISDEIERKDFIKKTSVCAEALSKVQKLCKGMEINKNEYFEDALKKMCEAKNKYMGYCTEMLNSNRLKYEHKAPFELYFKSLNDLNDAISEDVKDTKNAIDFLKRSESTLTPAPVFYENATTPTPGNPDNTPAPAITHTPEYELEQEIKEAKIFIENKKNAVEFKVIETFKKITNMFNKMTQILEKG